RPPSSTLLPSTTLFRSEGSDLADVLRAWDFAPTLSSKRFRLDVDGRWPGSPAAVSLAGFSGVMGGRMDEGQVRELDGNASALRVDRKSTRLNSSHVKIS